MYNERKYIILSIKVKEYIQKKDKQVVISDKS